MWVAGLRSGPKPLQDYMLPTMSSYWCLRLLVVASKGILRRPSEGDMLYAIVLQDQKTLGIKWRSCKLQSTMKKWINLLVIGCFQNSAHKSLQWKATSYTRRFTTGFGDWMKVTKEVRKNHFPWCSAKGLWVLWKHYKSGGSKGRLLSWLGLMKNGSLWLRR